MEKKLSKNRTAVYRRNERNLTAFLNAFPCGEGPSIPDSYFALPNDVARKKPRTNTGSNNGTPEIDDVDSTVSRDSDGISGVINLPDSTGYNNPYVHDNDNDYNGYDNDSDDQEDDNDHVNQIDGSITDTDLSTTDEESFADSDVSYDDEPNEKTHDNDLTRPHSFLSTNNMPNSDIPLLSKHNITIKDHMLATLAMSVRHHLTYEAMIDQLKWIKTTYFTNFLPTSKDQFWELLNRNDSCLKYNFYCKKCNDYLGEKCKKTKKLLKQCICKACGPNVKSESDLSHFIYISLSDQLEELLSIPNISKYLKYRFQRIKKNPNAYEDLYDGQEYKSLCLPGNFLEQWHNFSFTLNTDGCNVANSSNSSAWPIYVQVNELPPHMRKKHMLLAAIFVDQQHPQMNNFLRPFTDEIQKLYTTGVTWKPSSNSEITSKFIVTTASLDAPARAAVVCLTQYNGYFGCLYCYAKGKSLGRGKFVYPFAQCYKKLRTDAELRNDMAYVFDTGKMRHGVKNISSLVALPLFSINKGVVVEAMHAVYLGVVRQHTRLLLTNTKAPYYVGNPQCIQIIDNCLLSIRPPSCRSRKPRSIATYPKWKASEWRNWLEYAPICLQEILDAKYVNHLALLSEVIYYLNSDCLTPANLARSEILLKKYVMLFEEYFGCANMTSNMHLMTHLVDVVRDWGPLWAHYAFNFEAWNKKIMDFVTSSYARTNQIAVRFLMQKFLINTLYDDKISSETRKFIARQIKMPFEKDFTEKKNRLIGLGKCTLRLPTSDELILLIQRGYNPTNMKFYEKMKLNGLKYACKNEEILKFCDSTVYDGIGTFGVIDNLVKFESNNEIISGMFIKRLQLTGNVFDSTYINVVTLSNELCFIKETSFIKPATQISSLQKLYVIKQTNCWETD